MRICIVIPAYNEEDTLKKVVEEVKKYIKTIIVVDDASIDSTPDILKKIAVIHLRNTKNLGYAKTLEKGIKYAFAKGADYVITFDADGQHKAIDLLKVVKIINKYKPDLVIGKRNKFNRFMESIIGVYAKSRFGFSDPLCGLKAYKKSLFLKYGRLESKNTITMEIVFRAVKDKISFKELDIQIKKRKDTARLGGFWKSNFHELRAFLNILSLD